MLKNFKTYQLSLEFRKLCLKLEIPSHLRDQLFRTSSSVALNLAEGSAKPSKRSSKVLFHSSRFSQRITSCLGIYLKVKSRNNKLSR